jgi:hypothetical protein
MAKSRAHEVGEDAARSEAASLVTAIRRDLESLTAFLDTEAANLDRKGASAKRVARLRLIAQDVDSAATFARRHDKG